MEREEEGVTKRRKREREKETRARDERDEETLSTRDALSLFDLDTQHSTPSFFPASPSLSPQAGVADVVLGALDGYNGTVLAYGQTGSGKTHTMIGALWERKWGKKQKRVATTGNQG